jgi:hypothetical protein
MSAAGVRSTRIRDVPPGPSDGDYDWRPVRHHLGISAFGVNAWLGDAGVEVIEEHDEHEEGTEAHEELYLVVSGRAAFEAGGERIEAPAGTLIAITDPGVVRRATAEEDGTVVLAVGAPKDAPFRVSGWESRALSATSG